MIGVNRGKRRAWKNFCGRLDKKPFRKLNFSYHLKDIISSFPNKFISALNGYPAALNNHYKIPDNIKHI